MTSALHEGDGVAIVREVERSVPNMEKRGLKPRNICGRILWMVPKVVPASQNCNRHKRVSLWWILPCESDQRLIKWWCQKRNIRTALNKCRVASGGRRTPDRRSNHAKLGLSILHRKETMKFYKELIPTYHEILDHDILDLIIFPRHVPPQDAKEE